MEQEFIKKLGKHSGIEPEQLLKSIYAHTHKAYERMAILAGGQSMYIGNIRGTSTPINDPQFNLCIDNTGSNTQISPEQVQAAVNAYIETERRFMWWAGPDAENLGSVLRAGNLNLTGAMTVMAIPLPTNTLQKNVSTDVKPLDTNVPINCMAKLHAKAYNLDGNTIPALETMFKECLKTGELKYVVIEKNGISAAAGSLFVADNIAGIYNMATHPDHQGKGLGIAIVQRLLKDAYELGHKFVILQSTKAGLKLYESAGFKTLYHYAIYMTKQLH